MNFNEKLTKQISETAYLSVENTDRYRPIMRMFYYKHQQGENYLSKEEIYNELKDYIKDYTLEDCLRDIEFLVSKLSLIAIQDIENANTLEKFKYNNFRYEMSEYAVEIEEMTIRLEELEVTVSSLEPKLFERISIKLKHFINIENLSIFDTYEIWTDLMTDFNNLTKNYQDFIKQFQNPKTEELLQMERFIEFKNKFLKYINDFIKEYLDYSNVIKNILIDITNDKIC